MTVTKRDDGTIELICTEREARSLAISVSEKAEVLYSGFPDDVSHDPSQVCQALQFDMVWAETYDDMARALFEVVGF